MGLLGLMLGVIVILTGLTIFINVWLFVTDFLIDVVGMSSGWALVGSSTIIFVVVVFSLAVYEFIHMKPVEPAPKGRRN